jgi:thiamine biosynthesis lipoprotein
MRHQTNILTQRAFAMATFFEVALWGREDSYLQLVADEALREIQRVEQQLSFFRSDSEVRGLNVYAADRPVPVDPRVFRLIERAKALAADSGGAFDITIAPLLKAWGFQGSAGAMPTDSAVESARKLVGMDLIELNPDDFTVQFTKRGVQIDLGAIGKGYGIERAAEIIRDAEIPGALIHGGTSTVEAIGLNPEGNPWPVAIQDPTDSEKRLAIVPLADSALSISAVHGKFFMDEDQQYGHVLDPRTGSPVQNALLAAVVADSAADSDALSTALLVRGEEFLDDLLRRAGIRGALILLGQPGSPRVASRGIELLLDA